MVSVEHSSHSVYYSTSWSSSSSNIQVAQPKRSASPLTTVITQKSASAGRTATLEQTLRQIEDFKSGKSDASEISLSGISPSTFNEIVESLENYRLDFRENEQLLIISCPNIGHEIMTPLAKTFYRQEPKNKSVEFVGTGDIDLCDGVKSPDFSIFSDDNPDLEKRFSNRDGKGQIIGCPSVVVEVAYSEKPRDLARDCDRWISCSHGRVRLAIGIDIDYTLKKDEETEMRILNYIKCHLWEIKKVDRKTKVLSGERLDALRQTDGKHQGPASSFSCLSYIGSDLFRFHSYCRTSFQVYPDDGQLKSESIRILQKHVYRSKSATPNATIFELKLQEILDATLSLQRLQILKDHNSSLKRKRQEEEEDGYEERARRQMFEDIDSYANGLPD